MAVGVLCVVFRDGSVVSGIIFSCCIDKDGIVYLVTAVRWVPPVRTGHIGTCDDGQILGEVIELLSE